MAGNTFGRQVVANIGNSVQLTADGNPERKIGGVTVDWSTVTAADADTELADGVLIEEGDKYLRYGQVLCLINKGEIATVELGAADAGNFTLSYDNAAGTNTTTTGNIAYNANATTVKNSLEALATIGTGNVVVTGANGSFTITFAAALGNGDLDGQNVGLTNGSITVNTTSEGSRDDLYGPYDPDAVDGRQTLTRGEVVIVNETIKENDLKSAHPDVLVGGDVWKDRLIATTGSANATVGPTFTDLYAAMPRLTPVTGN